MTEGTKPATGFRSAWRHRRWRWLLGSVGISLAGDLLYWVALVVFLVGEGDASEGAGWVAAVLIVRLVPYVTFGPIGGAIADRFDRRRLLVTIDLVRAGIFTAMAILIAVDGPRLAAVVLVGMSAVCGTMYRPTLVAATPFLVTEDDLAAANAAETSLAQLSFFVGPALGAALVAVIDPAIVVAIDAATFLASAAMVARIGQAGGGRRAVADVVDVDDGSEPTEESGIVRDVVAGFRVVANDRGVAALVVLVMTVLFMFGAEQVLFVLVAGDRLGLGPEGVGVLMGAAGLGGLLIAPFTGKLGSSARIGWLAGLSGVVSGSALAALALVDSRPAALLLVAIDGAGAIVFEVTMITLLQRAVADDVLGRVYAVQDALSALGEVGGSVVASVLAASIGIGVALGTVGLVGVSVSATVTPMLVALAARLEVRRRELRSTTEWFATIDELAAFEPAALERLARASSDVEVPAGTVVLREGDRPDDLYVVRSGRLAVTVSTAAQPIPELVADDLFGEIGLLRRIPRTATVTALTDAELVRIDGSVFVDVALGGATPPDPLARGVGRRLGRTHPHLVERSTA